MKISENTRKPVIQIACEEETRRRLKCIADYHETKMSPQVVRMIDEEYELLPRKAR